MPTKDQGKIYTNRVEAGKNKKLFATGGLAD
jgi:hypothetical protein